MTLLEQLVADIKKLPANKLGEAYDYVHRLREQTAQDQKEFLAHAFGSLSTEEAEEWERNVQSCRKIDVESW